MDIHWLVMLVTPPAYYPAASATTAGDDAAALDAANPATSSGTTYPRRQELPCRHPRMQFRLSRAHQPDTVPS